ncbi:MAG: glycosyltransferase [Parcubacteria group bacterium Gr01-1014_19]|nr:MAG: glycosyltransferase [Parcubacteria group bacterium Gr01-1014_19]
MRVTIATGIYPPDLGGPAKHAEAMRKFLESRNCKVAVVAFGASREGVWGVPRFLPFGLRHFVYFLRCLTAAFVSDLIYAQDAVGVGLPALLAAKLLRRKFVVRVGGDLVWERINERARRSVSLKELYVGRQYLWKAPVYYWLTRCVLSFADAVIVPAAMLKDLYSRQYNIDSRKIFHFPNPELVPEFVKEMSRVETDRILFAGRFVTYKNLDLLMRAFDQARRRSGRGQLVLVGDGPERHHLETLRNQLSAKDFIEIRFPISREELAHLISDSGVCVGPALTEFNPNFILECLAMEKPVLISAENGLSVRLPVSWIFDARSESELVQKIEKMLDGRQYQNAILELEKIPPTPAWEETAENIFSTFTKLCGY